MEQRAGVAVCPDRAPAAGLDGSAFVREYLALLEEGWAVDLEEFLSRVPEPLRDEVFAAIDAALANPPESDDPHLLPQAEVLAAALPEVVPDEIPRAADAWVHGAVRLLPSDLREDALTEIVAMREEMRREHAWDLDIGVATLRALLHGMVQRAPLVEPPDEFTHLAGPRAAELAARTGWLVWRPAGPLVFLGAVFAQPWLVACGVGLLIAAFACLIVVAARTRPPYGARQATLVNALLGGMVAVLYATLAFGAVALVAVGVAVATGHVALATAVATALLWCATGTLAAVTARGWTPLPWTPQRLVRV